MAHGPGIFGLPNHEVGLNLQRVITVYSICARMTRTKMHRKGYRCVFEGNLGLLNIQGGLYLQRVITVYSVCARMMRTNMHVRAYRCVFEILRVRGTLFVGPGCVCFLFASSLVSIVDVNYYMYVPL